MRPRVTLLMVLILRIAGSMTMPKRNMLTRRGVIRARSSLTLLNDPPVVLPKSQFVQQVSLVCIKVPAADASEAVKLVKDESSLVVMFYFA